uniref:SAP domain-containing protein n=1 Tax=viral metagenome TaxID=1070528 RepID=A0A6C0AKQ6_9ZZZZ
MTGLKTKTLRRMLKKAGLKVSGKKATLRARAKKAHILRGGQGPFSMSLGSAEESMPLPGAQAGGGWAGDGNASFPTMEGPGLVGQTYMLSTGGRRHRHHGLKTKSLKKILKKAGLKTSGKKSTLTKRAKSAHLLGGSATSSSGSNEQAGLVRPDGVWDAPNA